MDLLTFIHKFEEKAYKHYHPAGSNHVIKYEIFASVWNELVKEAIDTKPTQNPPSKAF